MLHNYFKETIDSILAEGRLEAEYRPLLSRFCTFKIGGPAEAALWPRDTGALTELIAAASACGQKHIVCGSCSNILFSDEGYSGAVIFTTRLKGASLSDGIMDAECGAPLSLLAMTAQRAGLSGLEFAYGIPGSLGGAVFMNAGAYGGEMKDIVVSSDYYDTGSGTVKTLEAGEHLFGYRFSSYMNTPDRIILSAKLSLKDADPAAVQEKMDANMNARRKKQPLEYPSAGSAFKRAPGHYTAAMIDEAGLKGFSVGGAQVSEKHAGFIINRGGATADDVKKLISIIREKIYDMNGVDIEPEIRFIDP